MTWLLFGAVLFAIFFYIPTVSIKSFRLLSAYTVIMIALYKWDTYGVKTDYGGGGNVLGVLVEEFSILSFFVCVAARFFGIFTERKPDIFSKHVIFFVRYIIAPVIVFGWFFSGSF